jgi:translation initiation factor 2 subunit 2
MPHPTQPQAAVGGKRSILSHNHYHHTPQFCSCFCRTPIYDPHLPLPHLSRLFHIFLFEIGFYLLALLTHQFFLLYLQEVPPQRKARKSVAFTNEQVVVDADGTVKMVDAVEEPKDTAQSHTPRTPPLSAALEAFTDTASQAAADDAAAPADDGGLDLSLLKKKKKKKVDVEATEGDDAAAPADDGGLDLTMKKKKKKKAKDTGDDDEFTAKLKQLEVQDNEEAPEAATEDAGDMDAGTGIWAHDETKSINYNLLLQRFFNQLSQKNPDHAVTGTKSYKIPPPQCMREGNRKTVFANIADICKRMKRTEEHVTAYLFTELGTNGSVDGSRRLVIKGRFQQKQIEMVLRNYISMYSFPLFLCVCGFANLAAFSSRIRHLQDVQVTQYRA